MIIWSPIIIIKKLRGVRVTNMSSILLVGKLRVQEKIHLELVQCWNLHCWHARIQEF